MKASLAMLMNKLRSFKGRDDEQREPRRLTTSLWLPLLR